MFPNKETINFANTKGMEPRFKVEFLEDAIEFLESLDEKTRTKILLQHKIVTI